MRGHVEHGNHSAALVGALSGLLASVPTAFHTYSAVDIDAMGQVAPIVWTAATWAVCGAAIAYVARRRLASAATQSRAESLIAETRPGG